MDNFPMPVTKSKHFQFGESENNLRKLLKRGMSQRKKMLQNLMPQLDRSTSIIQHTSQSQRKLKE